MPLRRLHRLLQLQLTRATMSANQAHRFRFPLSHAIRTGCALVAAGQLIGVSVAGMPRLDAVAAPTRALDRPLAFEANHGQADDEVRFLARGARYTAFFTSTETVLLLDDGGRRAIVRVKPLGTKLPPRVVGESALPGVVRYDRTLDGARNIFVTKLSPAGTVVYVPTAKAQARRGRHRHAKRKVEPRGVEPPTSRVRC